MTLSPFCSAARQGLDKRAYSGFIGQVSGTGTNTCVSLPERLIGKLGSSEERGMIINMEAGLYTGIPRGSFDLMLDSASNNPGLKAFEKAHCRGLSRPALPSDAHRSGG